MVEAATNAGFQFLPDIIILASAAIFVVTVFLRLKMSSVIGYFVAGTTIGLHGLGLVKSYALMDALAEFGVVFLLFLIGLELTFERLSAMRSHVFGFGTLQVIVTMITVGSICILFGIKTASAVVIGGGLALSSTAIVLQVLNDTGQRSTQTGRLSVAVLILQDLAVVPLLVLVPLLNSMTDNNGGSFTLVVYIAQALLKASIALIAIFVAGRVVLRPLFNAIVSTKNNELFMATTLLIILSAAFITEHFGLSMALGAFVAGLLVAETEYRTEVEHVVLPFKGLLLGLFFMTIGMSIDLKLLIANLPIVIAASLSLMAVKAVIVIFICRLFRFKWGSAINAGLLLSQGGEFAFILFGLEATQTMLGQYLSQMLMMVVTITMAITPSAANLGAWFASRLETRKEQNKQVENYYDYDTEDLDRHIIVAGFGDTGRLVSSILTAEHVHHLIIEPQSEVVYKGQNDGFPVYQGDVTKLQLLQSVKTETACAIILTMGNDFTLKRAVEAISTHFPNTKIIMKVKNQQKFASYSQFPIAHMIAESCESALQLASYALEEMGLKDTQTRIALREKLRESFYQVEDERQ